MNTRPGVPITPATKVADLLDAYPELEDVLVAQAPAFRRLRNPVLRRTVARMASLEQAAAVGGLSVRDLVAALRSAAGQPVDAETAGEATASSVPPPPWLEEEGRVAREIDADALLDAGTVPLGAVNAAAAELGEGEILRVVAGFRPVPLVEALTRQGYFCFMREAGPGRYAVFVARRS